MDKNEIIERLENLARCAVHTAGELPFVMSLDDGIAIHEAIDMLRSQPEPHWIPFRSRPMTEEEKEMHPDIDSILDCKLPDDGQAILVTIEIDGRRWVSYDEYYDDCESYLDSGYEICTEATAWKPLPEPYGEDDHETD